MPRPRIVTARWAASTWKDHATAHAPNTADECRVVRRNRQLEVGLGGATRFADCIAVIFFIPRMMTRNVGYMYVFATLVLMTKLVKGYL